MDNFSCISSEMVTSGVIHKQFWNGINVWIRSPHVENRRLCGTRNIVSKNILEPDDSSQIISILVKLANQESLCKEDSVESILKILENVGIKLDSRLPNVEYPTDQNTVLKIRELLPKNSNTFKSCKEAIILDGKKLQASFIHLGPFTDYLSPWIPYCCCFKQNADKEGGILELGLWTEGEQKVLEEGADSWLKLKLFPRLVKWIVLEHNTSSTLPESSLNLIDVIKYNEKYQELKQKYGPQMVEIWPEQTDPLKFVYEDLAIASYLLCLWDSQAGDKKVSFVDLGCGNGLLVHILISEGHPGLGLDVRSRKLWALYPPTTRLQVQTVTPSPDTTFPEYDWIIGNHSDELTPWIPVMSALSSANTSFFLLPCCAYDFWGKYQRLNPSNSQYVEYIKFIRTVGETCGFKVEIDKLRIPSTKRTCLVGRNRFKNIDKTILWEYVTSRKQTGQEDFNPRPEIEPVRNCTKLPSYVTESVVKIITARLLEGFKNEEMWWSGNELPLSEAATLLTPALRAQMKSECGGLQTLLRNQHGIFVVQSGTIKFRKPVPRNPSKIVSWKNRPCWFFLNHPQGCPLKEEECSYAHVHPTL